MNISYMTEDEAKQALDEEINNFSLDYCPACNGLCKSGNCHSFRAGHITEQNGLFAIISPWCASPLVTGEIYHNAE